MARTAMVTKTCRGDDIQRGCDEIAASPVEMLIDRAGLAHYMSA
jgi:hypothetical protein